MDSTGKWYLRFNCGDKQRLVNVRQVVEIIPMVSLRHEGTDQGNPRYAGLLDYRGRVIPVFDLEAAGPRAVRADRFLIVISGSDRASAVVATEVHELLALEEEHISGVEVAEGQVMQVGRKGDSVIRVLSEREYFQ